MIKKVALQVVAVLFGAVALIGMSVQAEAAVDESMQRRAAAVRCLTYETLSYKREKETQVYIGRVGEYTPYLGYQAGFAEGAVHATAYMMLGISRASATHNAAIMLYKREKCTVSESI